MVDIAIGTKMVSCWPCQENGKKDASFKIEMVILVTFCLFVCFRWESY